MAIRSLRCHVSQASVAVVTDLEGTIERVICPEYDAATRVCRLKQGASRGGPLSELVERLSEETLDSRGNTCELLAIA